MSWRAPDLKEGVLLVAEYPFDFADDVDVVYGPANFIYYPEKQAQCTRSNGYERQSRRAEAP